MLETGIRSTPNVLELERLRVAFRIHGRTIHAVNDASLTIAAGEGVGLVGESGSGKSSLARALLGLLPSAMATVAARRFSVSGADVALSDPGALARLRGHPIAMVFQDPLSYLNPLMSAGSQIAESVRLHDAAADSTTRVRELLDLVRLPANAIGAYPHELSGGMRQRVMLAIALGCRPDLLIADEPTTALDVTTQAEILDLLQDVRRQLGMALLLITHDLGTVAKLCDRVFVMYGGHTVEAGRRADVFDRPLHPYTQGLLWSAKALRDHSGRFVTLAGDVPKTTEAPPGCPFAPRCAYAMERCNVEMPAQATSPDDPAHVARCWLLHAVAA